jgi:tetratricopeptide (TPR) repeat protein
MFRANVKKNLGRTLILSVIAIFVAGCDLLSNAKFMERFQRQPQPKDSTTLSEQAIGKFAKGEILQAQVLFDRALQNNPRDVHALLGKGLIFQQTGQIPKARAAFEAVLALQPGNAHKLVVMNNLRPQSLQALASMNLALLKNQGLASSLVSEEAQQMRQNAKEKLRAGRSKRTPNYTDRSKEQKHISMVSSDDKRIIVRFETLLKLRDQGLLTPDEYDARRKANLGALLNLTQRPPAVGLNRTVPSVELIIQRLRAIGKALELRAITVRQHGAERTTIINGLMPADPQNRALPQPAPKGLLASADAIRRVEMLQEKGLITLQEATREKLAIEKTLSLKSAPVPKKVVKKVEKKKAAPSGPRPAVHIASFRSRKAADRGWAGLRRAHRALLGNLKPEITRVNLGGKKGVFFRLVVGPLASNADAVSVCRQLKRRRQYCEPAFMAGG